MICECGSSIILMEKNMRKNIERKLLEYFDEMKENIIIDCEDERHICAIRGSIGRVESIEEVKLFKKWLEDNKIKYTGNL